jgi:hypothetical protein
LNAVVAIDLPQVSANYVSRPSVNAGRSLFTHDPNTCTCAEPSGLIGLAGAWATTQTLVSPDAMIAINTFLRMLII